VAGFPFERIVTPAEVRVRFGRWVVRRVALTDIDRFGMVSFGRFRRAARANERWGNCSPLDAYAVLHRKSGWYRNVVVNPSDPRSVLAAVRREAPHNEPA
jgi:hypothetical protein